jgi:hypothetical protein
MVMQNGFEGDLVLWLPPYAVQTPPIPLHELLLVIGVA